MCLYNNEFYENRHNDTVYSAERILAIIQEIVPKIKSAVDLGCGVGTWLSVLEKRGASEVCGIDGNWVNKDYLEIQPQNFIEHNFSEGTPPKISNRTFDLAISLELAEHLPSSCADGLISLLASLSDVVLFSAAIPCQGGIGHINEQWPDYWIALFEKQGFIPLDTIRKRIFDDEKIQYWYRQNILLFIKDYKIKELHAEDIVIQHIPAEVYLLSFRKILSSLKPKEDPSPSIIQSLKFLLDAIKRRIKSYER
ncbi:methyltransferase domain-containing protein [Desulfobacter postgatei]|uniref:class I SAM-dependent methyltransferase n=1 Tax=Desulfobacter postgatei TaxID=2293 RepID=UPI00259AEE96|nr:methyltransferase domain-containing protein [uncultured Desulfobacter sp.]